MWERLEFCFQLFFFGPILRSSELSGAAGSGMRDPRAPAWSCSLVSRGTNLDPKSRSGVGFGVPEPPSFPGKWEKRPGSSIRIGIKSQHSPPGSSCAEIWEFGNCCHSRPVFTFLVSSLALPKLPRQPHPRPGASQRSGSRSCRGSSWSLEKPSLDVGKPPGNGSQKVGKEGREGGRWKHKILWDLEELPLGSRDFWAPFLPVERDWNGMSSQPKAFHDSMTNSRYP